MRATTIAILTAVSLTRGAAAAQEDWSQFRGPGARGVADDAGRLPVELDPGRNLLWKRPVGAGHSSPCIRGERIFLTGATESELETICIDRASGEVLWRRGVTPEAMQRLHPVNSAASSTAAADDERVYVYFGAFGLLCYDHDGDEVWRREMPVADNTFGSAASPIVVDDLLIFVHDSNTESFLEAIEGRTGETVWRVDRSGFRSGWSTPVRWSRDGVDELLVYGVGWLTAYDLADGSRRWSVPGLTDEPIVTPVTGDGLVFVTSYNMNTNPEVIGLPEFAALLEECDADGSGDLTREEADANESILSRSDADGEGDHPLRIFFGFLDEDRDGRLTEAEWGKIVTWLAGFEHANGLLAIHPGGDDEPPEIVWQHTHGVPECPSPLYYRGRVYLVKNGGLVSCLNARTGELEYRDRLGSRGPCYASPVAGDGKVYTASARGVVTVFAAGDTLEVLARSDLGERILATPALADGAIYVRTERALYAFGDRPAASDER